MATAGVRRPRTPKRPTARGGDAEPARDLTGGQKRLGVLGHWGDTRGRKHVLILCMFLMGISTMAVGLLPTYQQVGMLAPTLLVIFRLIQGFAVAGEISGASSMILEPVPFGRRAFYSSSTLQGVQAGQILAAAVFLPLAHYMP